MALAPGLRKHYHVFLASPGDVAEERQAVRKFFDDYNRHTAHIWNAYFEVIDWENHGAIGVGRPQEIITRQTLEKYKDSLALVVGIMAQRFGTPSGKAESGTEEEFNWAMESHKATKHPEIKWFFRKIDKLEMPSDPDEIDKAVEQWKKVRAFRKRMEDLNDPVFFTEYVSANKFAETLGKFLNPWLADPARPWAADHAALSIAGGSAPIALPVEFDAERYQAAILKRFDKLNFDMLDTTGANYSGVRLWRVFVPQSVRECHQYNPRLLEIPKEHQQRLLKAGEITKSELDEAEHQAERQRREYFAQPLRAVLDVLEEAIGPAARRAGQKLVILGDPGSGKSSLIRYLALRWARIAEPKARDTQPIPLVIDLREYSRWDCVGRKGFVRYLEEASVWHEWPKGLLANLLSQPDRMMLLLDGLDEIFELPKREQVINDIQRFAGESPHTPILLTSRVVGYQPQRLRDTEFRHFMLQDLDAEQIVAFLDRWHEETFDDDEQAAPKRERLTKAVRDSKSIAMLAGNPLLLTMMAILNRNQELPRDRADLYAQASRVLLHQWDFERFREDFPGLSADVGLREKTEILRRVASHMQAGPGGLKGNLIDGPTLTRLIEDYLRDELHFNPARAAANAVVDHLRLRNFILCFVGADSYAFVHRTFLEYFCAAEFVHKFNIAKTLDTKGLIALFDEHCRQDEWSEVLRLICGQIDEAFLGRVVERLATRTDLKKWDPDRPLPDLVLAIECLAEARSPTKVTSAADVLLEQLIRYMSGDGSGGLYQFLGEKILPATRGLGERWPTNRPLGDRAFEIADSIGRAGMYLWVEFVAIVDPNRSVIEHFLTHSTSEYRASACRALAHQWPDDATRELIARRALQDNNDAVRSAALQELAEKWPDDATREMLAQSTLKDDHENVRSTALQASAEKWPDDATREMLVQSTLNDDHENVRRAAVQALAEKWPDHATRQFLAQCTIQDDNDAVRSAALQALAEKWPDEATRDLLAQRATQDSSEYVRRAALQASAEKWPDDATRDLLAQRVILDPDSGIRGAACSALGKLHSEFGSLLPTKDLDGVRPYLDPLEPIPADHIKRAARKTGIARADIPAQVASLSAFVGWDITRGAKYLLEVKPKAKRPRKGPNASE